MVLNMDFKKLDPDVQVTLSGSNIMRYHRKYIEEKRERWVIMYMVIFLWRGKSITEDNTIDFVLNKEKERMVSTETGQRQRP